MDFWDWDSHWVWNSLTRLGWLGREPREFSSPYFPNTGITAWATTLDFVCGLWRLNSGPCVYESSTLLTEPSSQPNSTLLQSDKIARLQAPGNDLGRKWRRSFLLGHWLIQVDLLLLCDQKQAEGSQGHRETSLMCLGREHALTWKRTRLEFDPSLINAVGERMSQ